MTETFFVGMVAGWLAVVVWNVLRHMLVSLSQRPDPRPIGRALLHRRTDLDAGTQVVTYGCPRCSQRWVGFFDIAGRELMPEIHADMKLHDCRSE